MYGYKKRQRYIKYFFKEKKKLKKKPENILVVGGTGFIGYNFINKIIKKKK